MIIGKNIISKVLVCFAFVLVATRAFCFPADVVSLNNKVVEKKDPGNPKRTFGYVAGILDRMKDNQ